MTDRPPDVELAASVKAKRLRFRSRPEVDVGFSGDTPRETSSGSDRENLPDRVEPGVTYRDVRVHWHAAARLDPRLRDQMEDQR
jgi:hypothetical protein